MLNTHHQYQRAKKRATALTRAVLHGLFCFSAISFLKVSSDWCCKLSLDMMALTLHAAQHEVQSNANTDNMSDGAKMHCQSLCLTNLCFGEFQM